VHSWSFYVDDRSESSSTFDMIMGRDLLGELGIIMNFNDHTVTWDTENWHSSNEGQIYRTLSSAKDLIEVYLSTNEPQTLRDKYSQATNIIDAEYKQTSASLDDVIKTCENLHIEEQYEHQFDGALGELDIDYWTNWSPTDGS
jgi:hypothetical protein